MRIFKKRDKGIKREKRAEETLNILGDLIDTASICIMTTDRNGKITNINQAGELLYGYRADEIVGQNIKVLFSDRNPRSLIEEMDRKRLKGESWDAEVWRKRKDGTEMLTWLSTSYLFNEKREMIGALGIARDITQEQQSEQKLRMLGDLIDTASICIMTTNRAGTITSINQAGELLYGYHADEIVGKNVKVLFSDRNPRSLIEDMDRKRLKGESWDAEVWRKRKDDTEILTRLSTTYLFNEEGEIVGALGIARDITQEQQSEQKLRMLGDLIDTASICIMTTNRDGTITSINQAGELLYGYYADEIVGKNVKVLFSDRNPRSLIEDMDRKRLKGESWDAEVWRKRKDDTEILTWLSTSFLFNENREMIGTLGIGRDITGEKQSEEKLQYLAELVDCAANCIISTDANGIVTSINRAGVEMFGYREKELVGNPASILWPEKIPEELRKTLAKYSAKGESWEAETLGKKKNGEIFPIWLATSYLRDEKGDIKRAVGISRDLTSFKEYEYKLRYMTELVEKASLGIISTDIDNRIISLNKTAEKMYGYRTEELIGRPIDIFFSERNPPDLLKKIKGKADSLKPWSAELYRKRKDGSEFISWLSTAFLFDETGNVKVKVCIERDVTEQREMGKRLAESEHLANLGELAAGVAHEVRNPLSGILTSARILLDEEGQIIGREERSLLQIIEQEATRLEGIVTDFLRFGKPQERIFSKVNIIEHLKDLIRALKLDKTIKEGIDVKLDFCDKPALVRVDENQMRQIFLNLILNSIQAMEGSGELIFRASVINGTVKISLEDTGPGISPENLKNIFKPFFSTKKKGTGLGLAIVKRIVDDNNGAIYCKSELSKGTIFTVAFPLNLY